MKKIYVFLLLVAGATIVVAEEPTGWGIPNTGVAYHSMARDISPTVWNGTCYGMVRAEIEYMKLGRDHDRSFRDATTPAGRAMSPQEAADPVTRGIMKSQDQIMVEQFAAFAQDYSLRNRNYSAEVFSTRPTEPSAVAESFRSAGVSNENPQILIMKNKDFSHAVLVRSMDENDRYINYRLKDPNAPGEERLLRYDKNAKEYEGYPEYKTFLHDNVEMPAENARRFRELIEKATDPRGRALPVWDATGRRRNVEPPAPSRSLNGNMSAENDPKVGGVRLYFDPSIVETSRDDARGAMIRDMTREIAEGRENILVQEGRSISLKAISLFSILAKRSDLGLTSIRGYITREGEDDIYLLGTFDAAAMPISIDYLSVALAEIWRDGHSPAISLDPDPTDPFGRQNLRLVDLDEAHRNTRFTKEMVDADYMMKKILFTADGLSIDGFNTTYRLLQENPRPTATMVRYWLYPRETRGADVSVIHDGTMTTTWFESEVKVLTEKMKDAKGFDVAAGTMSEVDEEAARSFTAHYDQIAELEPVYRRLNQIFGVAKLAAVLRARGEKNLLLYAAAARNVERVDVPDHYDGIGPIWVEGTSLYIGGGCELRPPVDAERFLKTPTIIFNSVDAGTVAGELNIAAKIPSLIEIDSASAHAMNAELEMELATEDVMAGRSDSAVERLDRIIENLGRDTALMDAALIYRSLAHLAQGRTDLVKSDMDHVRNAHPLISALGGFLQLWSGDREAAWRTVCAAAKTDSDRMILSMKAQTELMTLRFDDAESTIRRLEHAAPSDPEIAMMRQNLRTMRALGRREAEKRVLQYLKTPFDITVTLEEGQSLALSRAFEPAIEKLKRVLAMSESRKDIPREACVRERAWLALISIYYAIQQNPGNTSLSMEDIALEKEKALKSLSDAHPDWVSAWLVKVGYGVNSEDDIKKSVEWYRKAITLDTANDPLFIELSVILSADPRVFFGINLAPKILDLVGQEKMPAATALEFLAKISALVETGPARHYLGIMKEIVGIMKYSREIMARHGASPRKRPDPATQKKIMDEMQKELGLTSDELNSMAGLFESRFLRMPKPRNGAGITDATIISKYYFPALVSRMTSHFDAFGSRGDPSTAKAPSAADLEEAKALMHDAMEHVDIEWSSLQAFQMAAAVNNTLHIFYASTRLKSITDDPRWARLRELVVGNILTPEDFVTEERKLLDELVDADQSATPMMREFTRVVASGTIVEGISKVMETLEQNESSEEGSDARAEIRERWALIRRNAGGEAGGFKRMIERLPLDRPMEILMAQQLISVMEKTIPAVMSDGSSTADMVRLMAETRARLDMRLATKMR